MGIRSLLKVSRKTFFDPKAWVDYETVKTSNKTIWDSIKGLFVPVQTGNKETFVEAMARFGLKESDIELTQKNYFMISIVLAGLGLIATIFAFYLLFAVKSFQGWLLSMAVIALLLSQAFKYNFWAFQIKHRKLGCTFDEWINGKINEAGKTS
jgi:intracellular multiplication protein IcmV